MMGSLWLVARIRGIIDPSTDLHQKSEFCLHYKPITIAPASPMLHHPANSGMRGVANRLVARLEVNLICIM